VSQDQRRKNPGYQESPLNPPLSLTFLLLVGAQRLVRHRQVFVKWR